MGPAFDVGFDNVHNEFHLVGVGYKFDFKWSFLEGRDIQPYVYFCMHGGVTDWTMFAIHPGMGFDLFVTDRTYFTLDGRIGYAFESADVPKDAAGNRNYEDKMEAALTFGVGVLLGSRSVKK